MHVRLSDYYAELLRIHSTLHDSKLLLVEDFQLFHVLTPCKCNNIELSYENLCLSNIQYQQSRSRKERVNNQDLKYEK
jgi:hypothetical protein